MSCTLNVTPFLVTGLTGSGSSIEAGAHAWQIPHHVGMQRPLVSPRRMAHASPDFSSHSLVTVHSLRVLYLAMPCASETFFSRSDTPNALPYLAAGDSLSAPSQRWLT